MNKRLAGSWFVAMLLALVACATPDTRIQKARTSVYQTDYPIVWNAVVAATRSEGYDRIKVEDAVNGKLISDWHKIERVADTQATDPGRLGGMDTSGAIFFRVMVTVEGKKPPYKVFVDGEAARYRPGFSSLFPYKHGVADEPEWVAGRIDALYVAVLNQLEQYAVPAGAVQAQPAPAPKGEPPLPANGPGPVGPQGNPAGDPAAPPPPIEPPPAPPGGGTVR